jgi:hypothetical protein
MTRTLTPISGPWAALGLDPVGEGEHPTGSVPLVAFL